MRAALTTQRKWAKYLMGGSAVGGSGNLSRRWKAAVGQTGAKCIDGGRSQHRDPLTSTRNETKGPDIRRSERGSERGGWGRDEENVWKVPRRRSGIEGG